MKFLLHLLFLLTTFGLHAQQLMTDPTPSDVRMEGFERHKAQRQISPVRHIPLDNAGPRIFSGRITDLSVNPDQPEEFLVAYASGGLWHTATNGSSFRPIFDQEASLTIGAIACDWTSRTIWVGTGEVNSSRSSYAGTGVYRSDDFGESWVHTGLEESHHIGRIVIDPVNPRRVYVAVLGHLYSPNAERGVYATYDGGESWFLSLAVDERTGAVDIVMDPQDRETLYAATWERQRYAWHFEGSGPGSGIYKTDDAGYSWNLLTDVGSGFPSGEGCGRIGLSVSVQDTTTILYALLDNQNRRPAEDTKADTSLLTKTFFRETDEPTFLALDNERLEKYLRGNNFPEKYTAASVKELVRNKKIPPSALADYLEDANAELFDTPVIGGELYRWQEGRNWERTHEGYIDDFYFSYGYYFGYMRSQMDDPDNLYILGVPILRSTDGGKTFFSVNGENVHVDHHVLWMNPRNSAHIILGNDGGANMSYDHGESWFKLNRPPVGQFYTVAVDLEKPFNIYGGTQDNGVWKGPSTYKMDHAWEMSGRYPFENLMGGDGMQVKIDPRDNSRIVYTGYQFGNYFRIDTHSGKRTYITPKPELGERPYRWNWQTPIHLSVHNPDILYMGSQKVLRSMDRGDTFAELSHDLTRGGKKGNVPYGTLTTLHESPLRFGLIYAGSDDGLVHVSRDGGYSWFPLHGGWPDNLWVSRVQASSHQEGRVWLSLNGYRWDHFAAYVYRSDNYGETWNRIGLNLPDEPVNVVREDPVNPNLIYVGTDHGVYASLDEGVTFAPFDGDLPRVAVHDLAVQPDAKKLVIGTHGRSFYVADISVLQQLTPEIRSKEGHLFTPDAVTHSDRWGGARRIWQDPVIPEVRVWFYGTKGGDIRWSILTEDGKTTLSTGITPMDSGLDFWDFDLRINEATHRQRWDEERKRKGTKPDLRKADDGNYYLPPGTYIIRFSRSGKTWEEKLKVQAR